LLHELFPPVPASLIAISARAAAPIRCETSRETDRTGALPRYDNPPPSRDQGPSPASPDHTKHTARVALPVPPKLAPPPCQLRCAEGPAPPAQDVPARRRHKCSSDNLPFARPPLSRSPEHSAADRHMMSVTPLQPICDESFSPAPPKTTRLRNKDRVRHSPEHCPSPPKSAHRSNTGSPEKKRPHSPDTRDSPFDSESPPRPIAPASAHPPPYRLRPPHATLAAAMQKTSPRYPPALRAQSPPPTATRRAGRNRA